MSWIQDIVNPQQRAWEDFYRNRWEHDKVIRSTHGVNCTGGCAWDVYVKNGIITWETQALDYPDFDPDMPPYEPRGCQRGISFSWYIYSPIRVKYPYIRGVLADLWREAKQKHANPIQAWASVVENSDARASYQRAIASMPDYAEAHYNLGNILRNLLSFEHAQASYRQALAVNPDYSEALNNLGISLVALGELDDAVESYAKAIAINPDFTEAHVSLGIALKGLGRLDDAYASYQKAIDSDRNSLKGIRNLLFLILNIPGRSPEELFEEHLRLCELQLQGVECSTEAFTNDPAPDRRLRIGYLSSDFRDHPVGDNILPLLSAHDHKQFEVICYADVQSPDAMTERFQSCVDGWHPITGMPDADIARMIRADQIDLLICLARRFDSNRPLVSAYRAAPVQVSFHDGATSGLMEMDFWLTDEFLHPSETKEKFTEQLYRLPVFYQYLSIDKAPPVETLPNDNARFITFGSFNNPAKVNEEVIRLWAKVLNSVPGSRLLLKYRTWFNQPSLRGSVIDRFAEDGIEADRIIFETSLDTLPEHLGRYAMVDIALDPFPFNGATTTFQALWMGVPVITLAGESFISRAAGSMLYHAGLGDFVVDTPKAYVAAARELAGDIERLRSLRRTLRERVATSPLCDAPAYARSIEIAYQDMWRKWCARPKKISKA